MSNKHKSTKPQPQEQKKDVSTSTPSETKPLPFWKQWQFYGEVIKTLVLILGFIATYISIVVITPKQQIELKEKEFGLKAFEEMKSVYGQVMDGIAKVNQSENLDELKTNLKQLKVLSDGRYLIYYPSNRFDPDKTELGIYVNAAWAFCELINSNVDMKEKINKRRAMRDYTIKVRNSIVDTMRLQFPNFEIGISREIKYQPSEGGMKALEWEVTTIERQSKR
jgi:hypothetical protein